MEFLTCSFEKGNFFFFFIEEPCLAIC
jgi:hypothetical protein